MKIRSGFISNSSSSSFIVAFPKGFPHSPEQLQSVLFNAVKEIAFAVSEVTYKCGTKELARIIYNTIKANPPNNNQEDLLDLLGCGIDKESLKEGYEEKFEKETGILLDPSEDWEHPSWQKFERYCEEKDRIALKKFLKENIEKDIYVLKFADWDNGEAGIVLKGGIPFKNTTHIMIA